MTKQSIYLLILLFVIFMGALLIYQSQSIKRVYKAETLKGLERDQMQDRSVITEQNIRHLPDPLQKYLRYVGVVGKVKPQNVRIAFRGEMKLDPKQGWTRVEAEQYNFPEQPTRLFYIRVVKSGIPIVGLDSYLAGKGNMLIKVAGLLKVADARGTEMDISEMVTLFNDICLYSPAVLIDDHRFQWEAIDARTVKGTFQYQSRKVSALLYFNETGQLTNFVTDDRYYSTGKTYQRVKWSTPVGDYRDCSGVKIPTYGEGVWHFKTGDYCYAKFRLKEIEYDCKKFK